MTDGDRSSSKLEDDLLREVRTEIDRSAHDLRRLTERVNEQNVAVERLEVLVSEILKLLPTTAVVVDANGLIAAISRGASEHDLGLSKDTVGQPATSALPAQLGNAIIAVARAREQPPEAVRSRTATSEGATHWVDVEGAQALALPGRWALAVLNV